uniref:Phosphatidylserine synthase n=1 Tax=Plectus sambesii TaxID=2011161 RepID=A0A914VZN9_9BILA
MRQRAKWRDGAQENSSSDDELDVIDNLSPPVGAADDGSNQGERISRRRRTKTESERDYFQMINERLVEDITVEFFYKPHTLSVLAAAVIFVIYTAFTTDDESNSVNAWLGFKAVLFFFLIISVLAFPNGPFIRPHPAFWRIIFGLSVLYLLLLLFSLFQNFDSIKGVLAWLDPERLNKQVLDEKEYAINCSDVSVARVWSHMDIFAVGHFLGWGMKALIIRHGVICWYISIAWEITEMVFTHLLPNFQECWWDALLLDVLLCNGLGIWMGLFVCKKLEMQNFHWESIKNIKSTKGKFKRAVLQFTPASWTHVNWFDSFALRRFGAVYLFVMVWLVTELNTFFLKHIFAVDTSHPLVFFRIILVAFISAPTIRQYYLYATDPRIKRLGMQCWVYLAICILEASICIKFGRSRLPGPKLALITLWIIFMALGTVGCVYFSVVWARKSHLTTEVKVSGQLRHRYLDSSFENLGAIAGDVELRRRQLLHMSESDDAN